MRPLSRVGVILAAGAIVGVAAPSAASETRYFPHRDRNYLRGGQQDGGAAFVVNEQATDAPMALVVFLHGTNSAGERHLWLGGGSRDLRPLALRLMQGHRVRPFVLAAPSQTKGATLAHSLWSGFELSSFVRDVEQATHDLVRIDPAQVVLVGHSGAGCNPSGGLADSWTDAEIAPLALVSIDPCLDEEMGAAFARRPSLLPLSVWWQSAIWKRSPDRFWNALTANGSSKRIDRMTKLPAVGPNPHEAIVPIAFERMVLELLTRTPP